MTGNFAKLYLCFLFGCWENSVTRKEIFLIFSLTCSILLFVCKRMKKWAEHRERIAGCFCCVQWWKSGICNFKLLVFRRFLQQPNRIFVCIIGVVGITFWVPKLILLGSEIETLIFFSPCISQSTKRIKIDEFKWVLFLCHLRVIWFDCSGLTFWGSEFQFHLLFRLFSADKQKN